MKNSHNSHKTSRLSTPKPLLDVKKLNKKFDGFTAIESIDFQLFPGERHAVIGPNGAGKTTFFNLITGHLKPNSGEVLYESQSITQLPPHNIVRRGIARSFQRINIYPRMTVFQNIQVSVIARNKKHFSFFRPASNFYKKETQELLELVTLSEEQHGIAGELSYGKQKQLELAISLASNPKVLLLDEPTAGMSPSETLEAIELIKDISIARALTLLFTEHDMGVVFGIADKISVLHHGKVLATGTPDAVRKDATVQSIYLGDGEINGAS
tara:strand:+ start:48 stop:854 length:807 start_codon:yes stop_codon:yes gene_type:complete